MKKLLLLIFFIFFAKITYCQLDTRHWFAPMADGVGNPNNIQRLYLSTNQINPFEVKIYNNNIVIGKISIKKGSPGVFDIPRHHIITTTNFFSNNNLFNPVKMGLYLEADYSFFANLRFSTHNHAEIITSKGSAGTGTLFYTVMAPLKASSEVLNFMTSILATEDNTTINITNFNPDLYFSDGVYRTNFNILLNKGESYIIEGKGSFNIDERGFIGAKIESNKPISVTNGNFNGQYAGYFDNSSDILMDQSVPVNQLGNEFIIVKGNGNIGDNMESAIVVATEDNTKIFVNDNPTSIQTINEGEYYIVTDNYYQHQGNEHYNLYIKTSKKAYIYQLLAGASDENSVATGGMNFIPALSCFLPKSIDEIGLIDQNRIYSNNNMFGIDNIPTKLNIITEKGAKVTINGSTPNITFGPFPIIGNRNWETYSLPNQKGNVTIISDKAVTAGIIAGSDAAGYGGFFAGLPTQPSIVREGCYPNATLKVTPNIYESYQWYLNGVAISGATENSYKATEFGYYSVEAVIGSCEPLKSNVYKLVNCPVETELNFKTCQAPISINTDFSVSLQTINFSTFNIIKNPSKGKITLDPTTNKIIYTPTDGALGEDDFQYQLNGSSEFEDTEIFTIKITLEELKVENKTIYACDVDNIGIFDLTTVNISNLIDVSKKYYSSKQDAENEINEIIEINNFSAEHNKKVYVVVKTAGGCKEIAEITLALYPLPILDLTKYQSSYCGNEINVDLEFITSQVLSNKELFSVKYYANLDDATLGNNNSLPNKNTFTKDVKIYIRIESKNGCQAIIEPLEFVFGEKVSILTEYIILEECDENFDGITSIDLNNYLSNFTTDGNTQVSFYSNLTDAHNNTNSISPVQEVNLTKTFYIRFEQPGLCQNIASIIIHIKTPTFSTALQNIVICPNTQTILDPGNYSRYLWSNNQTSQSVTVAEGEYWVELTSENNCSYRHSITIKNHELPVFSSIQTINDKAVINAEKGNPPYLYSIDGINWQNNNTFVNLENGNYTAYILSSDNCSPVKQQFTILKMTNFISPNGDGKNDQWIVKFNGHKNVSVQLYNRTGKIVKDIITDDEFIWDGKHNGFSLPSDSYWYRIKLNEKEVLTGYITLKNK